MNKHPRLLRKAMFFFWIVFFHCVVFSQTGSESFTLKDIEFTGLKEIKATEAVAAGGLRLGGEVKIPDIDEAAQKLVNSGFFKSVTYKYRYIQRDMNLEFQVEETDDLLPCIFDNFIWFDRNELLDAIKNKIPLFEGTIPKTGTAPQDASEALEELLRERRLPGSVIYMTSQRKLGGPAANMTFSIDGIRLPIYKVLFPGANAVSEAVLQEKSKSLLGQNYTLSYVEKFAYYSLGPLFRQKGYLRVAFREPEAALGTPGAPEDAVTVAVGVIEGRTYTWDKAIWTGDLLLSPQDLNRILGMQTGEIADAGKIDNGLEAVNNALKNNGYLEAGAEVAQQFDDSAGTVVYDIRLAPGAQYRMGTIEFKGLSENIAGQLHARWQMKPGSIFNLSYFQNFIKTGLIGVRYTKLKTSMKTDRRKAIVDVVIEFL